MKKRGPSYHGPPYSAAPRTRARPARAAVAFERERAARNRGDVTQFFELAQTLCVQSMVDTPHASALRREARALVDRQPAAYRALRSVSRWRALFNQS